jgi:signal transduction histidine kinase
MAEAVQVLLVEDDADARRLAAAALTRAGWQVIEAASGPSCLAALRRGGTFVVLLDLGLSDAEGRELLAQLTSAYPETPSVVVTEVDDVAVAIDAMQRGAWDYVVKRPDLAYLDDLPRVVARTVERLQLVRERNRYREEVEALATALRGTTDGIVILDAGGRISFVNRALATAWQKPESAIVGRMLHEFVSVQPEEADLADVLAAIVERGRWSGEMRSAGVEPPGIWDVTLTPLASPEGTPQRPSASARAVVGIFRDVSEKHALEQLRADFLSMVTHDIRVPLTVILGYTEMLSDPEPPPEEVPLDVVSRIRESGEKIYALVCNFLDLSRIEAGRLRIDPRPVDLGPLLVQALDHHGAGAKRKGVALTLETESSVKAAADPVQIERVIANLLSNAIKFTPSGGSVTVRASRANGAVAVAFRDTGRGIPADELPRLFEKYRRLRETERTEGTGLGLFIAKTIVEAHGGSIRVESTLGVGSTFTVLLPAG